MKIFVTLFRWGFRWRSCDDVTERRYNWYFKVRFGHN